MDWLAVGKNVVSAGAPLLGTLLGGPAGAKLGSVVASLLGCEETPDAVHGALAGNPDALVLLRKYEMENAVQLGTLHLQETQAYLADVANARGREQEIVKATGHGDYNLYLLAWTVVAGFFYLVWSMMGAELPLANVGPVNQLFGAMSLGFGAVLNYFFGSSKSSADKTKLLNG